MSKSPKEVFEAAATVGLGTRGFTPRALATVFQGVKEAIDELSDDSENNSGSENNNHDCEHTEIKDLIGEIDERLTKVEHALFPFVEFRDEYRECKFKGGGSFGNDYISIIQYWDTSGAGTWTWAWMVEFDGSDVWTDVDDLDASTAASIGYDGSEAGTWLHLFPPVPNDLPDIKIRLDVTDQQEGFPKAEGSSDPFLPRDVWINKTTSFSTTQKQLPIKKGKKLWLTQGLQLNTPSGLATISKVAAPKNIKATKKNESITKRKGTA